jgi:hypothetical protein
MNTRKPDVNQQRAGSFQEGTMKSTSRFLALIAGALVLMGVVAPAHAVPIPIDEVTTITVGDKEFSNFTCATTTNIGNTGGGCDGLNVEGILDADGDPALSFTGGLIASGDTSVLDVIITYDVNVLDPNQAITQISLLFNGSLVGDSATSVTETVRDSEGDIIGQLVVSATSDLQDPPFENPFDIPLSEPVQFAHVTKDIILSSFSSGSLATISLIEQDFEQIAVPAPAALLLLGAGMLVAGAVARRRR